MPPKADLAISDLSQQVALLHQSVTQLTSQMGRMEDIIKQWEKDTSSINTRLVVLDTRFSPIENQVGAQWKRIDSLKRLFWIIAITQIIIVLLLFGVKYIPLIKIP